MRRILRRSICVDHTNAEIVNGNGVANDSHDWGIDYIVDTLGRTIDFYYESNLLRKVRQDRGGGTWFNSVIISYAPITISTNFSGLSVDPSNLNGQQVWQPWWIEYPTGHTTRIFYTSYGQMYEVERWVPTVAGCDPQARRGAFSASASWSFLRLVPQAHCEALGACNSQACA